MPSARRGRAEASDDRGADVRQSVARTGARPFIPHRDDVGDVVYQVDREP